MTAPENNRNSKSDTYRMSDFEDYKYTSRFPYSAPCRGLLEHEKTLGFCAKLFGSILVADSWQQLVNRHTEPYVEKRVVDEAIRDWLKSYLLYKCDLIVMEHGAADDAKQEFETELLGASDTKLGKHAN